MRGTVARNVRPRVGTRLAACISLAASIAFASSAAAEDGRRCPNPIAIDRASDTAAAPSAVADPNCTGSPGTGNTGGNTGTGDSGNTGTSNTGTGNTGTGNTTTGQPPPDGVQQATKTVSSPPGVVVVTTAGFTGALFSHLDAMHGQSSDGTVAPDGPDGQMGLGAKSKARQQQPIPVSPGSPLTVYAMGTAGGGHRSDFPDTVGLNYESSSGILGFEYRYNRNLIVGVAGNYTTADATLTNGAIVSVQAVQAVAYLSYATKAWFIDALAGYGLHNLDMERQDSGKQLRSSPEADVFAAAIRGAYLFDLGGVRVGPLGGLTFVHSHIGGFTESGDPQLALTVASQTVDAATASAGVRFLAPFVANGKVVIPYLNVTLEHELGGRTRTLSANFALQPQQPVLSSVPNFHTPTYGKIEGGVTLQLNDSLSATLGAASTFAREDGYDYRVSAGLSYKF
jgi:outer membrane lipase/esterase